MFAYRRIFPLSTVGMVCGQYRASRIYAEMDGTVSREKRDGLGGRVSLPDHR